MKINKEIVQQALQEKPEWVKKAREFKKVGDIKQMKAALRHVQMLDRVIEKAAWEFVK